MTDVVLHHVGGNVVEETTIGGSILSSVIHAPGLDAPVLYTAGKTVSTGQAHALLTNARGDVVAAGDIDSGKIDEEQQFDVYGERTIATFSKGTCIEGRENSALGASLPTGSICATTSIIGRFGIAGARAHPETKLVDMRARTYAPHLKGFLTKDPLGTVDSYSQYGYVAGDPINMRDPLGLKASVKEDGVTTDFECDEEGCTYSTAHETVIQRKRSPPPPKVDPPDEEEVKKEQKKKQEEEREVVRPPSPPPEEPTAGPAKTETPQRGPRFALPDVLTLVIYGTATVTAAVVIGEVGGAVAGTLAGGGGIAEATAAAGEALGGSLCFTAETKVLMADGTRVRIDEIEPGDFVLSDDPEDALPPSGMRVLKVIHSEASRIFLVHIGGGEIIEATSQHPFWTQRGWVKTENLTATDTLVDPTGAMVSIDAVDVEARSEPTFNLSIDYHHTYFVGDAGVLVHNIPFEEAVRQQAPVGIPADAVFLTPKITQSTGAWNFSWRWQEGGMKYTARFHSASPGAIAANDTRNIWVIQRGTGFGNPQQVLTDRGQWTSYYAHSHGVTGKSTHLSSSRVQKIVGCP